MSDKPTEQQGKTPEWLVKLQNDPELIPTIRKVYEDAGILDVPETPPDMMQTMSDKPAEGQENELDFLERLNHDPELIPTIRKVYQDAGVKVDNESQAEKNEALDRWKRFSPEHEREEWSTEKTLLILLSIILLMPILMRLGLVHPVPEGCHLMPAVDIGGRELECE